MSTLVKIVIDAENKAAEDFDDLREQLAGVQDEAAKASEHAKKLAGGLDEVGSTGALAFGIVEAAMLGVAAAGIVALKGFASESVAVARQAGVMAGEFGRWDYEMQKLKLTVGTDLLQAFDGLIGPVTDLLTLINEFGLAAVLLAGPNGMVGLINQHNEGLKNLDKSMQDVSRTTKSWNKEVQELLSNIGSGFTDALEDAQAEVDNLKDKQSELLDQLSQYDDREGIISAGDIERIDEMSTRLERINELLSQGGDVSKTRRKALEEEKQTLEGYLDVLQGKGNLLPWEQSQKEALEDQLDDVNAALKESQEAWDEYTARLIFDIAQQQLAADGILSKDDLAALSQLGQDLGLYDTLYGNVFGAVADAVADLEQTGDVNLFTALLGGTQEWASGAQTALEQPLVALTGSPGAEGDGGLKGALAGVHEEFAAMNTVKLTGLSTTINTDISGPLIIAGGHADGLAEKLDELNNREINIYVNYITTGVEP